MGNIDLEQIYQCLMAFGSLPIPHLLCLTVMVLACVVLVGRLLWAKL